MKEKKTHVDVLKRTPHEKIHHHPERDVERHAAPVLYWLERHAPLHGGDRIVVALEK